MPALSRALAALLVISACSGGSGPTTTTDPLSAAALDFARSADRALDGTRFATVEGDVLAAAVIALCRGVDDPALALPAAIAGLEAPAGDPGHDLIVTEVLLAGVAAICPERSGGGAAAAFVAEVTAAVTGTGGAVLSESTTLAAGLAACDALDAGEPGDALVAIAAVGFGVEANLERLFGGTLTDPEAVTVGAILSAAAAHLCPEHAARVAEFINDLAS